MDEQLLTISSYAETALYEEVALSPKPGLVDRFSNGAHRDMDFQTFLASIQSLRPFFKEYLYLGLTHRGQPSLLFNSLRETGKMAETAMLKATKGINTHKGANFSFAVLLGATGLHMQLNTHLPFTAKDTVTFTGYHARRSRQRFSTINNQATLVLWGRIVFEVPNIWYSWGSGQRISGIAKIDVFFAQTPRTQARGITFTCITVFNE